jgi:cell division protein FtsW
MVYSASAKRAGARLGDALWFFKRQAVSAAAAVALLAAMKLGYRRLGPWRSPCCWSPSAARIMLPGLGRSAGGAAAGSDRGITFQPSELAKIALVLWLDGEEAGAHPADARRLPAARDHVGALGVLLMLSRTSATVVLGSVTLALLFVAGAPWPLAVAAATPIAGVLIWKSPYRIQRVLTFLDPWKDPRGHGYQTVESLLGFGAGGSFGVGLGESHQKLFFLPAAHTDFILSIVGEELGFAGVSAVLFLFAVIVWRGIKAAHAAPDAFGCWLALGLTCSSRWRRW